MLADPAQVGEGRLDQTPSRRAVRPLRERKLPQPVTGARAPPQQRGPPGRRIGVPGPDRLADVGAVWHLDRAGRAGERHGPDDAAEPEYPFLAPVGVVPDHIPPAVPVDDAPRLDVG